MASLDKLTTQDTAIQWQTYSYLSIEVKISLLSVCKTTKRIIEELFVTTWARLENELEEDPIRATHCLALSYKAHTIHFEHHVGNDPGYRARASKYMTTIYKDNWEERYLNGTYDKTACQVLKSRRVGNHLSRVSSVNNRQKNHHSSLSSSKTVSKTRITPTSSSALSIRCQIAKVIFIHGIKTKNQETLFHSALKLASLNMHYIEFDDSLYSLLQIVAKQVSGTFIASLLVRKLNFSPNLTSIEGITPLTQAVYERNDALALKLISWGADISTQDPLVNSFIDSHQRFISP